MGTALPQQFIFPRLALKQNMFRLGRAEINDYVTRESDKGGSKWLDEVSKCQLKIVMHSTGVFLRERVPKDSGLTATSWARTRFGPLKHNSEICFLGSNKKVFVFMSIEATSDSFP